MKRLILRLVFTAIALCAIAAFGVYLLLRASLPVLDGDVTVASLDDVVTIERDAAGIATVTATTRRDLAFATGFAHGQDRFFQMDLMRRQGAGELAALVGAAALPLDRRHRLHRFRSRAREVLESSPDADRELLEAYADGVNAAVDRMSGRPFEYLLLRAQLEPWRAEDSLLVLYSMFFELNDARADGDVQRGFAARVLPREVFDWLYPQGTRWDAPLSGEVTLPLPVPAADLFDLRGAARDRRRHVDAPATALAGSNSWAVSGALTASGRAIVANDMHLGLGVPNVFYRMRLIVRGDVPLDVSGVLLPGTPLVVTGSNGRVAWAFTNSYGDWSDAVVIVPGTAPGTYRSPEGERRFLAYREAIEVRGGEDDELLVRETVWGPVRDDIRFAGAELAVSWTAHHAAAVNLVQRELETASTVAEALDIANRMGIPPQNFVAGDTAGNIGWTIAGQIPRRAAFDARLPADWSAQNGWSGWLDANAYPRVVNPAGGRLWTANARVIDGAGLAAIGDGGYALGARAAQIRDDLLARDTFRPADMLAIQLDDRALFLQRWRDLLLVLLDARAVEGHPQRAAFRRLVNDWIPRAVPASTGYRLVRRFHDEVRDDVFDMLMAPVRAAYDAEVPLRISRQFEGPLWVLVNERPAHLVTADAGSWRTLLLRDVDRVLAALAPSGGPLDARSWGERNTAAIRHPLSPGLPAVARWLDMPRDALPGDRDMPRVQAPAFGAAERFAVSPGDEAAGYLHMPAGQSGHPLSPYYADGHADWVNGRAAPFLPGASRHRLTLSPKP
ncbi:MAG TPA: penicillin acylase family protein [Woeseiaceae bacterium]|nr:penicillin acylase family protein [Woeseiaceae bacterium]